MTTIYLAKLTAEGRAEAIRQANEIAGREWGSYEREFDALEERAGELKGYGLLTADKEVACEICSLDTASKRPEFIRLTGSMFDITEQDDE